MKRREALRAMLASTALPAISVLPAFPQAAVDSLPKLATAAPDTVAEPVLRFFNPAEMATLRKIADVLVPARAAAPGAKAAGAPEFLDFLLSASPSDRQELYRTGVSLLEQLASQKYSKPFAQLSAEEAEALLEPVKRPWTYNDPTDQLERFLKAAKLDCLQATLSSREFAAAMSTRSRSAMGMGTYWYPLD